MNLPKFNFFRKFQRKNKNLIEVKKKIYHLIFSHKKNPPLFKNDKNCFYLTNYVNSTGKLVLSVKKTFL